jgi:7,8-dihydropterin-6-yl-methyl-4-(beta-D-ribofuranosyl)aminobenzene 5'-phosphate synthase
MELIVVYDNEAKKGLLKGWGFSCFINTGEHKILFDTGWDGQVLLRNMELLGIDVHQIDILVLSHQHWDHIGGLPTFLFQNPKVKVYIPASFSANLKKEISSRGKHLHAHVPTCSERSHDECPLVHEITGAQEICKDIYTTGELGTDIKEQSLVVDTGKGMYVLTGCAHPGLASILGSASKLGDVVGILGGLHDSTDYDLLQSLQFIGAGHCTSHKDDIMRVFPETCRSIFAGFKARI